MNLRAQNTIDPSVTHSGDRPFSHEEREETRAVASLLRMLADRVEKSPSRNAVPCLFIHYVGNDDIDEMRKLADGDPSFKIRQHVAVLTPGDVHDQYLRYLYEKAFPILLESEGKAA